MLTRFSLLTCTLLLSVALYGHGATPQAKLTQRDVPVVHSGGLVFKDLNRNGKLDPFEDWRLSPAKRAEDLLGRMTLEEKAGTMVQDYMPQSTLNSLDLVRALVQEKFIGYFGSGVSGSPRSMAEMANSIQEFAEHTRLGIPIILSTDPRNHFTGAFGVGADAGKFSRWPDPPGLAATGDPVLMRQFTEIASQEYRAVGIRMALSPQADLATEPRWGRASGTFGSNPAEVGRFVAAYIEGFQGGRDGLGPQSVATVVKHWVGYGAEPGGYDAHNPYGKNLSFAGGRFADHVAPFLDAITVHAAGMMPTYGVPPEGLLINGRQAERVGAGFSRQMLTELLRDQYKFQGIIVSDYKITDNCAEDCQAGTMDMSHMGMPWGVESLSKQQRAAKAINAGVDQIGGTNETELIVEAVKSGLISMDRIDQSVRRLLIQKFQLGIFEDPYVDPASAEIIVGAPKLLAAALDAQHRSLVLLKNQTGILPIEAKKQKVWLWKVSPQVAADNGFVVVEKVEDADLAIARISTPFSVNHPTYLFGHILHEGSLSFTAENPDRRAVEAAAAAHVPVVVVVNLDRAAVLTPINAVAEALVADFGASDNAIFDVLTGRAKPRGHLPFELPSSEATVDKQSPDVADDSANPLYPYGFGLQY
jgi:beta-glucosidase